MRLSGSGGTLSGRPVYTCRGDLLGGMPVGVACLSLQGALGRFYSESTPQKKREGRERKSTLANPDGHRKTNKQDPKIPRENGHRGQRTQTEITPNTAEPPPGTEGTRNGGDNRLRHWQQAEEGGAGTLGVGAATTAGQRVTYCCRGGLCNQL